MPVLNFKYVVFSFSFIHLIIGSDYMISMLFAEKRYLLFNFWLNIRFGHTYHQIVQIIELVQLHT